MSSHTTIKDAVERIVTGFLKLVSRSLGIADARRPLNWKLHEEHDWSDWDEVSVGIMEDICRHKLAQHAYVRAKLLQTGNRPLVEDSPYDAKWGWGPNRDGRNELGQVWMRLRAELLSRE